MSGKPDKYVPALGFSKLTALYDPVIRFTTRETRFKTALISQSGISSGMKVLDVGCGTGTLALSVKEAFPDIEMVGLDGDPAILEIAAGKARARNLKLQLDRAYSTEMPYADNHFDRVLSSLFFHHLEEEDKRKTFREILRVLKPDGQLHVADWGKPTGPFMRALFYPVQMLDGFSNTAGNVAGRLPEFIENEGFRDTGPTTRFNTMFGTMTLYRATKP